MVHQDGSEFPSNSVQSGKNSEQQCLQANRSISVTSHSLGVCMSSIVVTEMCADKKYEEVDG